ncbi:MAG: FHA domain-containing protein [Anaerolineales bacterium]
MITCHVCQTSVYFGTLFCPECCARVSEDASSLTNALPTEKVDEIIAEKPSDSSRSPLHSGDSIVLRVAGNNVGIPLFGQQEYILGRAEKGQAVIPDIDMNKFGAHEKGVSRLHCHLRFEGESLLAIDLGSANGTFINDIRVLPEHPGMLSDGDILRLGNLVIEVTRQAGGQ